MSDPENAVVEEAPKDENIDDGVVAEEVCEFGIKGKVKWFTTFRFRRYKDDQGVRHVDDSGYGFITRDDGKPDVFVHNSAIKNPNTQKPGKTLANGEHVAFDVVMPNTENDDEENPRKKSPEARNVTAADGGMVQGKNPRQIYRRWNQRRYPPRRPRVRDGDGNEGDREEHEEDGQQPPQRSFRRFKRRPQYRRQQHSQTEESGADRSGNENQQEFVNEQGGGEGGGGGEQEGQQQHQQRRQQGSGGRGRRRPRRPRPQGQSGEEGTTEPSGNDNQQDCQEGEVHEEQPRQQRRRYNRRQRPRNYQPQDHHDEENAVNQDEHQENEENEQKEVSDNRPPQEQQHRRYPPRYYNRNYTRGGRRRNMGRGDQHNGDGHVGDDVSHDDIQEFDNSHEQERGEYKRRGRGRGRGRRPRNRGGYRRRKVDDFQQRDSGEGEPQKEQLEESAPPIENGPPEESPKQSMPLIEANA